MDSPVSPLKQLASEHCALLHQYGEVQLRCSAMLSAQARQIEQLRAQNVRLRAAVVVRNTVLAWANEDSSRSGEKHALTACGAAPSQRADALLRRLHAMFRKLLPLPALSTLATGWQNRHPLPVKPQRRSIQNGPG